MKLGSWNVIVFGLLFACAQEAKQQSGGTEPEDKPNRGENAKGDPKGKGSGGDGSDEGGAEPGGESRNASCPDFSQQMVAALAIASPVDSPLGTVNLKIGGTLGVAVQKKGMTLSVKFDKSGIKIQPALARATAMNVLERRLGDQTFELVSPAEVGGDFADLGCAVLLTKTQHLPATSKKPASQIHFDPALPIVVSSQASAEELAAALGDGRVFQGIKTSGGKNEQSGSAEIRGSGSSFAIDYQIGTEEAQTFPDVGYEVDAAGKIFSTFKASLSFKGKGPFEVIFK